MCCHEFLGQTAVSFTIVNKCYFCLRQQFSDAFCISTPEICLGWSHHVLRRPGGDAVWQPRYQTLTRHTVSLNTPCLISSCTPPRSVTDFWWQRWDNLISSGVKSGVASISRSPEIPDWPNCSLVNNSDLFSIQEILFVGAECLLQVWFSLFIERKHHWNM